MQTCIVHLIRASLAFVNWKERKALADFRAKYPKHQAVADVCQRSWQRVIPFFDFPEEIRKIIY